MGSKEWLEHVAGHTMDDDVHEPAGNIGVEIAEKN